MSYNIAVAGKGGTGKTSLSSLVVRHLLKRGLGPILAIDADANANLGDSLGLRPRQTVGSVLYEFQGEKINIPPGMTKEAYLEIKLNDIVVESKGLDLVVMGRGEGADCYCYPNTILRKFIDRLAANYAYTVMDNEAGMEHLSRSTTQNVDDLLIISDHSIKGVRTVANIQKLVAELRLNIRRQTVIINFTPGSLAPALANEIERLGIGAVVTVPVDEVVRESDLRMKSLLELPDGSPAAQAMDKLMTELLGARTPAR